MSTYIASYLTSEDAQRLRAETDHLSGIGSGTWSTPFQFVANFDGANNDKISSDHGMSVGVRSPFE